MSHSRLHAPAPGLFISAVAAALLTLLASRPATAFPSLASIVEKARSKGPASVLASADLKIAGSSKHAAGLAPLTNPYLEILVDRGKHTNDVTVAAALYLPIELSGQRDARIEEVDAVVKWKQMARAGAASVAVGEAVEAYGDTVVSAARVREAIAAEKIARDEAAYVAGRLAVNDATKVDAALADSEIARWLQSRSEAELSLARARTRLSIAIGEMVNDDPTEKDVAELPALHWKDADTLAAHLAKSPAVLAPAFEADYYAATKKKYEAEKYPPLNLVLLAGRGDLGEMRYGVGLAWTFPVLRKNQGEIARADAEHDRALTAQQLTSAAIEARARGLFASHVVARRAITTCDDVAVPAAVTTVVATTEAWKAGKLDLTRVFLARRDLATARARRLDVVAEGFRVYAGLAALLGELP